ncbi:MAG: helix-turn-helix domain-containing protein [Candidatus Limivivens sp.]|nr:helix-turn-helix domain-containing protein [Candidatus Limivivens sp.]
MERNYLKSDALVALDFITDQHIDIHSHGNLELLFVISGKLVITIEKDTYQLNRGDMVVVNSNRRHSYQGTPNLILGRFLISYTKVRELLGQGQVLFWCNSTIDYNEAYEELRRVIVKIFSQSVRKQDRMKLYLNSMYYQMLHILAENFLLTTDDRKYEEEKSNTDERIQEIFAYIRANYSQNITLDDLAGELYLSSTYVSKYIKKKCGINFMELLNTVRLSHAIEDLMYSEDSIMKIALENGFASVAAYNKAFKDAYQMTPSEFRKQRKIRNKELSEQERSLQKRVEQGVEDYLEWDPTKPEDETELFELNAEVSMETEPVGTWNRSSSRMVNAGTAMDLTRAAFQEQILARRDLLGIEYVRFWDIYAPELYIDIHAPRGQQNYSRLNMVTDFLVKNHLKPYIELGFKPVRILQTTHKALKEIERNLEFDSDEEMWNFYSDLMHNFITRYGAEEVSNWYFEYWEKTNTNYRKSGAYEYTTLVEREHREYFHQFGIIAGAFRRRLPGIRIGGGGFPVRMYGENGFAQILTIWKQEKELPDFLSLSCYPYVLEREAESYYEKRTTDMEFVRHNLEVLRNAVKKAEFPETEIHVSEYSFSLSNRNIINDSCLKGAFLVHNAISCYGKADLMGHWLFTDAYSEERDVGAALFGGCGLLTKDGIPKPSYYAMEFLYRMYPKILQIHPNYVVTRNDRGFIRVVCHNLKKPNYSYYITDEDMLQIRDLPMILENRERLTIHLKVDHVENGIYKIKRNQVRRMHGSVQDKWISLNMESDLTMMELDYLRASSISEISIQEAEVKNHTLELKMELEPNEIHHLSIYLK